MKKMTINKALPEGVIALMSHINAEKVATLFPDENAINDFDFNFQCDHGEREISHSLSCALLKSQGVDFLLSGVLAKYYNSWLREKEAFEVKYDFLKPAGVKSTISEKKDETREGIGSGKKQSALNAFNGVEASDTESETTSDRTNETNAYTKTTERETFQNYGQWTGAELLKQEVEVRGKMNFYDIVSNDIARELCCLVY